MKQCLIQAQILAYPNPSLPYKLYTDASKGAVGAIHTQDQNGSERVIQYLPQLLSSDQQKWPTIEQEAYAIIYSDHQPLLTLFTTDIKSARAQRLAIPLSKYSGDITYQTGKPHKADMLSRLKLNFEDDGLDLDMMEQMGDAFENNIIDSDMPHKIDAPEILDNDNEVVLDKEETVLKHQEMVQLKEKTANEPISNDTDKQEVKKEPLVFSL